jgi:hypothetical protein
MPRQPLPHTKDSDCDVGPDGVCRACGAHHGEPCPSCKGTAFHLSRCRAGRVHMLYPEERWVPGEELMHWARVYIEVGSHPGPPPANVEDAVSIMAETGAVFAIDHGATIRHHRMCPHCFGVLEDVRVVYRLAHHKG